MPLFNKQQVINPVESIFHYTCDICGQKDALKLDHNQAHCRHCNRTYSISKNQVILFDVKANEQTTHFNELYGAGYSPSKDDFIDNYRDEYLSSKARARDLINLLGIEKTVTEKGISILDAACGPGWLTAGLMQNKRIKNSSFHAFDVAQTGLEMLAEFEKTIKTSNRLEISVQDAMKMRFADKSFDVIFGNSMLHHLDDYEGFLFDCHRVLKPGGLAVFGEPFAIGYGLLAASLKLAQNDLGTEFDEIDALYNNIASRINQPRKQLRNLVDKHLFFQGEILPMVQKVGFGSIDFVSLMNRDYYRDQFVSNELRLSYGITNEKLKNRAVEIYRTFFDLFDSDRFVHAISAFMYVILRN